MPHRWEKSKRVTRWLLYALVGLQETKCFYGKVSKWSFTVLRELNISGSTNCSLGSRKSAITEQVYQVAPEGLCAHKGGSLGSEGKGRQEHSTHTACRGDLPGLLSLSLLLVCSIAPFSSSRMALAKLPRAGFPMEAVVYRGILLSAMEACHRPREHG